MASRSKYVNNTNGVSLLALFRTATGSRVDGIRKLVAGYLNPNSVPELTLDDPVWIFMGGPSYRWPGFEVPTDNKARVSQLRDIGSHFERLRATYERVVLEGMHRETAMLQDGRFRVRSIIH